MPDPVVEPCSEYSRASGPNAIDAALKKSKSMLQPFYTTGLKNVAELACETESDVERPVIRKKATRLSFGNVMAQARGDHDIVPYEKKKEDTTMKDEQERPNARADTPRSGVPASLSRSTDFSRSQKALQGDDQYRPKESYISRKPLVVKDSNGLAALLSLKKRNHQENQSRVKMCNHRTFVIYWDPEDPSNRNGSFIARVDDDKEKSHVTKHPCCNPRSVNVKEVAIEMASNIILKFEEQEDDRVTGHYQRRKGIEPKRSPPHSVVLREVHNMYSQLCRGEIRKLAKTEETRDIKLGAGERRKELAEQTKLAAQRSRQRGCTTKDHNYNKPESGSKPKSSSDSRPSERKKKTPKQIAEEKVARKKERRGLSDIARLRVEPLDRYKPSTVEEQQARVARVTEHFRHERAARVQSIAPATKTSPKSKKFAVAIDAAEDDETIPSTQVTKKATRRPVRYIQDSDDNSNKDENETVKTRQVVTKPKSQRVSKADGVLLAGIAQAGQEGSERFTQTEAEAASELKPTLSNEEKQVSFLAEIAVIERAQLAAKEKRQATPPSDDVKQSTQKKSRKSAINIEDSDEGTDITIPEENSALPHAEVRQEFTTEANQLVAKVQKQQEDKTEQGPKSSASPASRGPKRKNELPDSEDELQVSSPLSTARPIKKAKQNSFLEEGITTVEQEQDINVLPPAAEEAVANAAVAGEIFSDDTEGEDMDISSEDDGSSPITAQTEEEEEDDGLDYLFEE
ncbi:hypothetical protein G6011_01105 [Alternaria panax]|uniref:Uncharacterized protein n=1 Tax=Alternaria panax TaxID=48097 RepID=A0AAD4NVM8_9PLEO|nr:hypothetical protein G6011_01105 [Alternaria panax]